MSRTTLRTATPVGVVLVNIEPPPTEALEVAGYSRVLAFFRFHGAIVGQRLLPVVDGKIPTPDLRDAICGCGAAVLQRLKTLPAAHGPASASVSVVVCTRDRPELLRRCLGSLARLDPPPGETLVVDSAPSSDDTREVAREFPSVRYIRSPRRGLNVARNLGIRHSRGEFVAFTDDDALADPGWLEGLLPEFAHPMTALVSGITLPAELDTQAQRLFELHFPFRRGFARREFSLGNTNLFGTGVAGAGVNMAIRRAVLDETGLFDESLDAGTPTESGGDQELFYRILARGYRIVYQPEAMVWHRHRPTMRETSAVLRGYGTGVFAWWTRTLVAEGELALLLEAPLWLLRHHVRGALGSLLHPRTALPIGLSAAELWGAIRGPLAYVQSRWFHPSP